MRYYEATFFCKALDDKDHGPLVSVQFSDPQDPWPITLRINSRGTFHGTPAITMYMTVDQWINFKNSVISTDRQLVPKILGREHYE